MTLYETDWSITSDLSPEYASRTAEAGRKIWRLSWLPDRMLAYEEARAGMELDELLSDLKGVDDRRHQAEVDVRADRLGILREHAVVLLAKRMAARLAAEQRDTEQQEQPQDPPRERTFDSLSMANDIIEPPFVHD